MSETRSAEWLRAKIEAITEMDSRIFGGVSVKPYTTVSRAMSAEYRTLLAEAEAREARVPTAAEVIAAAERAPEVKP